MPCQRQGVDIQKRRATSPFPKTSNFQNFGAKLVGSCCAVRRNYCHCDPSLTSFGHIKWFGGHIIAVRDLITFGWGGGGGGEGEGEGGGRGGWIRHIERLSGLCMWACMIFPVVGGRIVGRSPRLTLLPREYLAPAPLTWVRLKFQQFLLQHENQLSIH